MPFPGRIHRCGVCWVLFVVWMCCRWLGVFCCFAVSPFFVWSCLPRGRCRLCRGRRKQRPFVLCVAVSYAGLCAGWTRKRDGACVCVCFLFSLFVFGDCAGAGGAVLWDFLSWLVVLLCLGSRVLGVLDLLGRVVFVLTWCLAVGWLARCLFGKETALHTAQVVFGGHDCGWLVPACVIVR